MKFTKMQGCGNDYVYINGFTEKFEDEAAVARLVSDRHFGIGGDGMIVIKPSGIADFEMCMYNADGSRSEMCGNGIRCVAKYVYDYGLTDNTSLTIESMGKIKYIELTVGKDGKVSYVKVDMGKPELKAELVPVISDMAEAVEDVIDVDGAEFKMTCVSMGNPHAVIFIDGEVRKFPVKKIGKKLEKHCRFPNRTNVEFARVTDRNNIDMRVWERGTGETLACGTGCCATAVAAIVTGRADNDITVHVLGGDIDIHWSGRREDSVIMSGPAVTVFDGEIDL